MKQFCNAGKGMCWKSKCCFVSVDIKCVWYRLWRIDTLWLNIAAQLLPVLLLAIVLLACSYLITFFDNELFLNAAVICGICITVNVRFFFGNVWIKGLFASLFLHNNMQPVIFLIKAAKNHNG